MRECVKLNNMSIEQLSNITFVDGGKTLRAHIKYPWLTRRRFADITGFALTFNDCVFLYNLTNEDMSNLNLSS